MTSTRLQGIGYVSGGVTLARNHLDDMATLYESDFVDPPLAGMPFYSAERFRQRLIEQYLAAPNFRVVLAVRGVQVVAFGYGCSLPADTIWWRDVQPPLPGHMTRENGRRTMAILDMLVARDERGYRVATGLHTRLLANRPEERVTLLSSPPQQPAYSMWRTWEYEKIGEVQPEPDSNVLHVFLRPTSLFCRTTTRWHSPSPGPTGGQG